MPFPSKFELDWPGTEIGIGNGPQDQALASQPTGQGVSVTLWRTTSGRGALSRGVSCLSLLTVVLHPGCTTYVVLHGGVVPGSYRVVPWCRNLTRD